MLMTCNMGSDGISMVTEITAEQTMMLCKNNSTGAGVSTDR